MLATDTFKGRVEFTPGFTPGRRISHVLFDFDGTLSLIRQGWPEVMAPMFVEMLPRRPDDTDESVRQLLYDDIMRLNGKQTIYQMMQLAERIKERGGQPKDPLWYKHEYLRRLDARIRTRLDSLGSGAMPPDDFLVYGSRPLLEKLKVLGLPLYLASGTDEQFVKQEAGLLDVTRYFGPHIYGAKDDYKSFSKKILIQRVISSANCRGEEFLGFGDGYVEIENIKEVGGVAVGVATAEPECSQVDPWKRKRLAGVGADFIVPNFLCHQELLAALFPQ